MSGGLRCFEAAQMGACVWVAGVKDCATLSN
jgi:hypothetical protein